MAEKPKWFCTDCEDFFRDETGERCPSCGFRRIVGPVRFCTREEVREALTSKERDND